MTDEPFHKGEIAMQLQTGERGAGRQNGGMVSSEIYEGAQGFIERQTFVVVASQDSAGNLWASPLFGSAGFLRAPTSRELEIDLRAVSGIDGDPVLKNLTPGAGVATIMIELETRRRVRANGRVVRNDRGVLAIEVAEFFGNCGKYIQRRKVRLAPTSDSSSSVKATARRIEATTPLASGTALGELELNLVARSDTMFVASVNPSGYFDVSHRGGNPGFVHVNNHKQLLIPDYSGNSMFTTFGNFQVDSRAGIVLFDFEKMQSLQISGTAKVLLDQSDANNETGGTMRFWTLDMAGWQRASLDGINQEFMDYSPWNPKDLRDWSAKNGLARRLRFFRNG